MLKLCLNFTFFGLMLTSVNAAPPTSQLNDIGEALRPQDSISTELTLGLPQYSGMLTTGHASLPVPFEIGQHSSFGQGDPDGSSQLPAAFEDVPYRISIPEEPPSVRQHFLGPGSGHLQQNLHIRVPVTPGLDASLETSLMQQFPQGKYLVLPWQTQYVPSFWFEYFYKDAITKVASPKWAQRFFEEHVRTDQQISINEMLVRVSGILQGGFVYKLKLPQYFSPLVDPGEVLICYHDKLKPGSGPRLRSQMSAWSTTNNGNFLAFLGLFHSTAQFFYNLVERASAEPLMISEPIFVDGRERLFLYSP